MASKKTEKDDHLLRTVTKTLTCKLTQDELLKAGDELAEVNEDIANEQDRHDELKASMKAQLTALEARRTSLAMKVRRREEHRQVQCDLRMTEAGMVNVIRRDTGEVIEARVATDDERQKKLELEPVQ